MYLAGSKEYVGEVAAILTGRIEQDHPGDDKCVGQAGMPDLTERSGRDSGQNAASITTKSPQVLLIV